MRVLTEIELGPRNGIYDPFEPVRGLVVGPKAIVEGSAYDCCRSAFSPVLARESPLRIRHSPPFFSVAAVAQ